MRTPLYIGAAFAAALSIATPSASPQTNGGSRTDLDAFMQRVLAKRDENWAKLQQYTLEEDERFQMAALNGRRMYGFRREYIWYPEDGVFMRSPVRADGVEISEEERRKAEREWRSWEADRDRRRRERERGNRDDTTGATPETPPSLGELVKAGNEPRFVSSAYFMKFKFDPGQYAFAGRETLLGREVYKIEYYPTRLFEDDKERKRREEQRASGGSAPLSTGDRIEQKMNKVALVELWIEPKEHQILQYEFSNIDFDFMPARSLVRLDDLRASMRMGEPFPGVWLPDTIAMRFRMTLAAANVAALYDVRYHRYKLAEVKTRVR